MLNTQDYNTQFLLWSGLFGLALESLMGKDIQLSQMTLEQGSSKHF